MNKVSVFLLCMKNNIHTMIKLIFRAWTIRTIISPIRITVPLSPVVTLHKMRLMFFFICLSKPGYKVHFGTWLLSKTHQELVNMIWAERWSDHWCDLTILNRLCLFKGDMQSSTVSIIIAAYDKNVNYSTVQWNCANALHNKLSTYKANQSIWRCSVFFYLLWQKQMYSV